MTSQEKKYLIFKLQRVTYALDLDHVSEVADPPKFSPIPLAPACYAGALNFHGNIVAVINLAHFLGLSDEIPPGKIIVLHRSSLSLAFLVDTVVRIVPETECTFTPLHDVDLAAATLSSSEGEATVLNLEALTAKAERALQK
jgi:purine-binding chemotaxis protein CheW